MNMRLASCPLLLISLCSTSCGDDADQPPADASGGEENGSSTGGAGADSPGGSGGNGGNSGGGQSSSGGGSTSSGGTESDPSGPLRFPEPVFELTPGPQVGEQCDGFAPDVEFRRLACEEWELLVVYGDESNEEISYQSDWSDRRTQPQRTVTVDGTYAVEVSKNTRGTGDAPALCSQSFDIDIDVPGVSDIPQISVMADFGTLCDAESKAQLSTNYLADEIEWSTGETTDSIEVDEPGTYDVVVTRVYGDIRCSRRGSRSIERGATADDIVFDPPDLEACEFSTGSVRVSDKSDTATDFTWYEAGESEPFDTGAFQELVAGEYRVVVDFELCPSVEKHFSVALSPGCGN